MNDLKQINGREEILNKIGLRIKRRSGNYIQDPKTRIRNKKKTWEVDTQGAYRHFEDPL